MEQLYSLIDHADETELTELVQVLLRRFQQDNPDYEYLFYALSKQPDERRQDIQRLTNFLNQEPLDC